MFIRLKKTPPRKDGSVTWYAQLVKSERVNGVPHQRVISHLGAIRERDIINGEVMAGFHKAISHKLIKLQLPKPIIIKLEDKIKDKILALGSPRKETVNSKKIEVNESHKHKQINKLKDNIQRLLTRLAKIIDKNFSPQEPFKVFISEDFTDIQIVVLIVHKIKKLNDLSKREKDVMFLIGHGLGNKGIGRTLGISAKTVANVLNSIFKKTGISSRAELTRYALLFKLGANS